MKVLEKQPKVNKHNTLASKRLGFLKQNQLQFGFFSILFVFLLSFQSCGVYSFTGASVEPGTKTVFVDFFPNKARIIAPILSQTFTEKLKDKFVNETSLDLVQEEGDLNFSGSITLYSIEPVASASNDIAELNRLTIGIKVNYYNTLKVEDTWDSNFSRFQDFDKNVNLKDVEEDLIEEITKQIVDDIFNKALVNW